LHLWLAMPQLGNEITESDLLFYQYVDVLNRVLSGNRGRLYGRIMKVGERAFGDRPIAVGVYRRNPASPERWFTVVLSGGRFDVLGNDEDPKARYRMKLPERHLEHVVENPGEYVEQPFRLALDRLMTRIGRC
jgi:hypothetical protein